MAGNHAVYVYRPVNDQAAINQALRDIALALTAMELRTVPELHTAPDKPETGQIVVADGSSWNPGSGRGFYGYDGINWIKLG